MPIQIRGEDDAVRYEFPHTLTAFTDVSFPNSVTTYEETFSRTTDPWCTGGFEAKEVNQGFDVNTENKAYAHGASITGDGMAGGKTITIEGVIKGHGHTSGVTYYTANETLNAELDRMRRYCMLPQTNEEVYKLFLSQYLPELNINYDKGQYYRLDRGMLAEFNVDFINEYSANVSITFELGDSLRYLVEEFNTEVTPATVGLVLQNPPEVYDIVGPSPPTVTDYGITTPWRSNINVNANGLNAYSLESPPTITIEVMSVSADLYRPLKSFSNNSYVGANRTAAPLSWLRIIKYAPGSSGRADFVGLSPLLRGQQFRINMEDSIIQRNNGSGWADDYREFDREFFGIASGDNTIQVALMSSSRVRLKITFDFKQIMI